MGGQAYDQPHEQAAAEGRNERGPIGMVIGEDVGGGQVEEETTEEAQVDGEA